MRTHPTSRRVSGFALLAAVATLLNGAGARAEVTGITGSSSATVLQFDGILPAQSDVAQVLIPLTKAEPPALSIAQVDRFGDKETPTAAGSALAIFEQPNLGGTGVPNDVGLDLAAFTDDDTTTWFLSGEANETRTIIVRSAEAGGGTLVFDNTGNRGRSRVVISGVMFILSRDGQKDLTGTEVKFNLRVQRRQFGRLPSDLLSGEVVLAGGADGSVEVTSATGSFQGAFLPVVDFSDTVPDLALVRAVLFAGLELPYEYDIQVGQPFELALTVKSEVRSIPGGVGASAVFGLPQANLQTVVGKVALNDMGNRVAAAIAQRVDTTGAAYQLGPIGFLFPGLCGATGVEVSATLLLLGFCTLSRRVRRSRRAARRFPRH